MKAPGDVWGAMRREADPLADATVAAIVGTWEGDDSPGAAGLARIAQATRLMGDWTTNASLAAWAPAPGSADETVVRALRDYLDAAARLPAWANGEQIERAERTFMEYGPLSCTLLFCASLPECYVLPHLAEVLHMAGQLEAHTEHRIRQTAAMIFPVMMRGGLMTGEGGGIAQVLKVRLIHATIRHLILHGPPKQAARRIARAPGAAPATMHSALLAAGWDLERQGMPCSQLELGYTLLTFSYVFLKGMRTLGIPMTREDEEACLHAWNVAGSVLGLREELMAHTMADAQAVFESLQAAARAEPVAPDVRPPLGRALIAAMERTIRVPVVRSLPVPLTRWLVGARTADEIGVSERVGPLTLALFTVLLLATRAFDAVVRLVLPRFSLTRMFTRAIGYHLLTKFLLDQTRPLTLPEELLAPLHDTVANWEHDRHAPKWVNRIEDRLTTAGAWRVHR